MDKIESILTRGVDKVYPSKSALEKVLQSGKKLRLYQGFDPTGTQLHIGHMVGFRKLAHFAELGHHVIFLVGDGTGQAGDPSGKVAAREKFFNHEELRENAKEYVMQAGKIIDFEKSNVEILYNSEWLNKLTLTDILDIANHFSVQQLIERDMFQERLKHNEPINLREFLYPILQGYDSVVMDVDLELGGSDQTFNMLQGRKLLKEFKDKEKFVMTTPLLADSKGVKIGKSEGNVIGLTDKPNDLYGKIMALSDDVIVKGFEYLTDVSMAEIADMERKMKSGANPMNFKKQLAYAIVEQLNSKKDADSTQVYFESKFQKRDASSTGVPAFKAKNQQLIDVLMESKLVTSKSEARRLLAQNAISINGVKVNSLDTKPKNNDIIKVGKSRFIKVVHS